MRTPVLGLVLGLAASARAAAPPIDSLGVSRSGGDLVISWSPPSGPVDGYRVYRSRDVTCAPEELVYDGAAPTFTDPGALEDLELALYRVASRVGPEEGPRTAPVYKFGVELPGMPANPAAIGGALVSMPPHLGLADAAALCADFNGAVPSDDPVQAVLHWSEPIACPRIKMCQSFIKVFDLGPTQALALKRCEPGPEAVVIWGHGHPTWEFAFPTARAPQVAEETPHGVFWVPLPYDHDYLDLLDLAADVPGAVDLLLWDPDSDECESPDMFVGLHRASSSGPWTGPNLTLTDRRGQGLVMAVDAAPLLWTPRRLCGPPLGPPRRIASLRAVRSGADVALRWPADPRATGGYLVYRAQDATLLPDLKAGPAYRFVGESAPDFPLLDAAAVADPEPLLFYQVVERAADGTLGDL